MKEDGIMLMGYYTTLPGYECILTNYKQHRIIGIPYEFYEPNGIVFIDFNDADKECTLSWYEILHASNFDSVYQEDDEELKDIMESAISDRNKRVMKDIVAFYIEPVDSDVKAIEYMLEHSRYYELRYSEIPSMVLDSFVPLFIDDNDKILAIGFGTTAIHTTDTTKNMLEMVAFNDHVIMKEVLIIPIKKSAIALNHNI